MPDPVEKGPERPSRHGAILGAALAQLAEAGCRAVGDDAVPWCATCAFKPGSMPNQMAATGLTAYKCAIGVDPEPFGCHHGLALDGQPTRLCAGWLAAKHAPWELVKEVSERLALALQDVGGDDPIRADCDAWLAAVDPKGEMDNYQLARLWLKRELGALSEGSRSTEKGG
jgi:hypothetical protein